MQRILGRKAVKQDISGLLEMLGNPRLNRQLLYTVLDILVEALFPELTQSSRADEESSPGH